jgi:hypothetical protein
MITAKQVEEQMIINEYEDDFNQILKENDSLLVVKKGFVCYDCVMPWKQRRNDKKVYIKCACSTCDTENKKFNYFYEDGNFVCSQCYKLPKRNY